MLRPTPEIENREEIVSYYKTNLLLRFRPHLSAVTPPLSVSCRIHRWPIRLHRLFHPLLPHPLSPFTSPSPIPVNIGKREKKTPPPLSGILQSFVPDPSIFCVLNSTESEQTDKTFSPLTIGVTIFSIIDNCVYASSLFRLGLPPLSPPSIGGDDIVRHRHTPTTTPSPPPSWVVESRLWLASQMIFWPPSAPPRSPLVCGFPRMSTDTWFEVEPPTSIICYPVPVSLYILFSISLA